jgi:hypothetical protein
VNKTTKKEQKERKDLLTTLDECGSAALEGLDDYMTDRLKNVIDGMERWDIGDPYLLGYARGVVIGFKMATDLVGIAAARAAVGDDLLDTDDEHFVKLGEAVDAINKAELERD